MIKVATVLLSFLFLWATIPGIVGSLLVNAGAVRCFRDLGRAGFAAGSPFSRESSEPSLCASAQSLFQQALAGDKNNAQATEWLGISSLAQGQYAEAEAYLGSSLQLSPNSPITKLLAGIALYKSGEIEQAIARWRGLEVEGLFVAAGATARRRGEYDQAELYHRTAARIAPDAPVHLDLAEDLYAQGRFDEALAEYAIGFAAAEKSWVDVGEASFHMAQILAGQGRYLDAVKALQQALALRPRYPYYLAALAKVYVATGEYEKAEYFLNETVISNPNSGYAHWEFGNYYFGRQMFEQAAAKFQRAVEVEPHGPAYYYGNLGAAYASIGAFDLAIDALTQALERQPDNQTYRTWLDAAIRASQASGETSPSRQVR